VTGELVRLPIEGMTCTSCVAHITKAVRKIEGVETVKVDLGSESAILGFDSARTSLTAIGEAIREAGYEPRVEEAAPFIPRVRRGLLARLGLRGESSVAGTDQ
jgi:copper ion binding protein